MRGVGPAQLETAACQDILDALRIIGAAAAIQHAEMHLDEDLAQLSVGKGCLQSSQDR